MSGKLTLSEVPAKALVEIASYLQTVRTGRDREQVDAVDGEVVGYWQTVEWLQGLFDIADKCVELAGVVTPVDNPAGETLLAARTEIHRLERERDEFRDSSHFWQKKWGAERREGRCANCLEARMKGGAGV